jgi:multiple sugar transport system substrate-binding protein
MKIAKMMTILYCIVALISGCAQKKEESEEKTIIKFAFWGNIGNREFAQEVVDVFNKSHPSIQAEFIPIEAGNYRYKLLTMVAGGVAPDIMLVMPYYMADFASRDVLLNLDPYANNDEEFQSFKGDIYPQLLKVNKFDGVSYSMPIWTNSIALFYNKTLFDKEGIDYPDETWDWDKLLSAAKKLTKDLDGDRRIDQFGFGDHDFWLGGDWGGIYRYIRRNGGRLFNEDRTKCLMDSPEAMEAVRWYLDLTIKHHVAPTMSQTRAQGYSDKQKVFETGRVAMITTGRWSMLPLSKIKNFEWGVAPEPHAKVRFNLCAAVFLSAYAGTKHPQACWEFIKFTMGKEVQNMISTLRSDIPILKSITNSDEFLNAYGRLKENKVFLDCLDGAEEYPFVSGDASWKVSVSNKLVLVSLGKMDLETACKEIVNEYRDLVVSSKGR